MAAIGGGPRARVAEGQARWQRPVHAAIGPGPGRRAQSPFGQFGRFGQFAGPRPANRRRERPGSFGNIFAPCMISGPSTRKGALDGKIRAPCIRNRPIAPGNGRIRRGSCHLDLEKHAFRADIAREGAFSRTRRERNACGAILASQGPVAAATRGTGTRAGRGGSDADGDADGARWARCGRGARRGGSDARGHRAGTRLARCGGTDAIHSNAQALPQRTPSALR